MRSTCVYAGAMRTWFARGLRGEIARSIQQDLLRQRFFVAPAATFVDGIYEGDTEKAVKSLQAAGGLAQTGRVDDPTLQELTPDSVPSLFERCLSLTAAFEAHGFGLLKGDLDGAGLTWGIVGFTLSNGEIHSSLRRPGRRSWACSLASWERTSPGHVMALPKSKLIAWAHSINFGASMAQVPPQWRDAFRAPRPEPLLHQLQLHKALLGYYEPCVKTARKLDLSTELRIALCFDMHVQNGKCARQGRGRGRCAAAHHAARAQASIGASGGEVFQRAAAGRRAQEKAHDSHRRRQGSRADVRARGVGTV